MKERQGVSDMSGIAGLVHVGGAPVLPGSIEAMLNTMVRRGPDAQRCWRDGNAALGQALLATTPEGTIEIQPWKDPDTGCLVVSDSRLDNRPELLRELAFRQASADEVGDGELLHAAYQRWGEGCPERLLGDFAFAIYDPSHRRLFCGRDVMGVRPFYYHHSPNRLFAFGSETRALLSQRGVPTSVDEGRIADAIVSELEGIDKTSTFYVSITRLPPAHTLMLDGRDLRIRQYWQPLTRTPRGLPRSEAGWIDALRDELKQAVRRRLRSSQRVGSMLSGGLDSSSVVALSSCLKEPNRSFKFPIVSVTDSHGQCVETRAVNAMRHAFDVESATIDVQSCGWLAPALHQHLDLLDEPFDGAMMLLDAVYRTASLNRITSVMDGMAADNLYTTTGYIRRVSRRGHWLRAYRASLDLHRMNGRRSPKSKALRSLTGTWAPAMVSRIRTRQASRAFFEHNLIDGTLISSEFARRVGLWERYLSYRDDMARNVVWHPYDDALSGMTAAYITAAVERYGRIAAFYGVEPRHPFLDRRVIEFHAWLPLELRSRNGWPKWALRQAMRHDLPDEIVWRRRSEHLGQRFNMSILAPVCDTVSSDVATDDFLSACVDGRKIQRALGAWRERGDETAFQALHDTALVVAWLRSQGLPPIVDAV